MAKHQGRLDDFVRVQARLPIFVWKSLEHFISKGNSDKGVLDRGSPQSKTN
jgi:hypothetical protein